MSNMYCHFIALDRKEYCTIQYTIKYIFVYNKSSCQSIHLNCPDMINFLSVETLLLNLGFSRKFISQTVI